MRRSTRGVARGSAAIVAFVTACAFVAAEAPRPVAPADTSTPAGAGTPALPRGFPARVELDAKGAALDLLRRLNIDVEAVFPNRARVWVVAEQFEKLRALGLEVTRLPGVAPDLRAVATGPAKGGGIPTAYHTHESLSDDLEAVATDHADIARLFNIGLSVQQRELWMMKISRNPDTDEDEPEFCYISSMHGDEVVGKELLVGLIHHLTDGYGSDSRVTQLVDGTEIWIMPSMNPDGTALAQRWNAHNVDLNRSFPDQFVDPNNTVNGREPETAAVMQWAAQQAIAMSANMHGGVLVVNYPFDGNPQMTNTFSPSPDQNLFVSISRTYADNNPPLSMSNSHPAFDDGITNGADWFAVTGGMQDWNYVWNGALEVTLELGTSKWPPATDLPDYWADNLESMLAYMERVHEGVRGVVSDAQTGAPVAATVAVGDNPIVTASDPAVGDYHRPLLPGDYALGFSAVGYQPAGLAGVEVTAGAAVRVDVALTPLPTEIVEVAAAVLDGAGGDGRLDPGESADLALTVRNLGATVTALTARLEPTGWLGTVTRSDAGYPDLAPGAEGESAAPHHAVELDSGTPVGHKAGFVLRWGSDQTSGVSEPFFLPTGSPTCETFAALDTPRSILDNQTTRSEITVAAEREVVELRVTVDITHTYIGDLTLTLTSPSGTEVVLHDRSGGAADDIVGTYGDDLVSAQPLEALAGESIAGTWALEVRDSFNNDTGTLHAWSIEPCGFEPEAHPPEMRLREVARNPDGNPELSWWPYPGLDSYRVYRSFDPSSAAAFVEITDQDADPTDTSFTDAMRGSPAYYLVTGVGPNGEGPKGHFGE